MYIGHAQNIECITQIFTTLSALVTITYSRKMTILCFFVDYIKFFGFETVMLIIILIKINALF